MQHKDLYIFLIYIPWLSLSQTRYATNLCAVDTRGIDLITGYLVIIYVVKVCTFTASWRAFIIWLVSLILVIFITYVLISLSIIING